MIPLQCFVENRWSASSEEWTDWEIYREFFEGGDRSDSPDSNGYCCIDGCGKSIKRIQDTPRRPRRHVAIVVGQACGGGATRLELSCFNEADGMTVGETASMTYMHPHCSGCS